MMIAACPPCESERLETLRLCQILDTPPDPAFDDLVRIAATVCNSPVALVSLVDANRQWFKAKVGISASETPRDIAFCAHAILDSELLEVPDATQDPRFSTNPLVTGPPGIRFYAGQPLITQEGHRLGTLCVIDFQPRMLNAEQKDILSSLSRQVVRQIDFGRTLKRLQHINRQLRDSEARIRTYFDAASQGILVLDSNDRIEAVNARVQQMFGYSRQELRGLPVRSLIDPENSPRTGGPSPDPATRPGSPCSVLAVRKDGSCFPAEFELRDLFLDQGRSAIATITDVTEIHEVYRELEEARDSALKAVRLKSEFLANMSHEIRTPMNGILGTAGLLLESPLSPCQRESAETIRDSAEALLAVVNDILDFSKIEADRLHLDSAAFDLCQVIEEVLVLLAPKSYSKGVELVLRYDPATPRRLVGDAGRVRQIVLNLIGNAVKFTESGHILVEVSTAKEGPRPGSVQVSVQDTGVGIDPSEHRLLFERFRQLDGSSKRRYGGTGLGLAISKRLVGMMGGEISVESALGKGSTFRFDLPLPQDPAALPPKPVLAGAAIVVALASDLESAGVMEQLKAAGAVPRRAATVQEITAAPLDALILDADLPGAGDLLSSRLPYIPAVLILAQGSPASSVSERPNLVILRQPIRPTSLLLTLRLCLASSRCPAGKPARSDHPEAPPPPAPVRFDCRVLLVEDNVANQRIGMRMLENLGCRVDLACNGEEALRKSNEHTYDLILMDCHMPAMDGLEATVEFRRRETAAGSGNGCVRKTPIVALTASAFTEDRDRCYAAGMDDFLTKPVRLNDLRAVLQKWTEGIED